MKVDSFTVTALVGAGIFSFISPMQAFAHGGGLAADGCHNDRKNGGRHCHGGGSDSRRGSSSYSSPSYRSPSYTPSYSPSYTPSYSPSYRRPTETQQRRNAGYIKIERDRPATKPIDFSLPKPGLFALVSVGDGDTIRVIDHKRIPITVRLSCIDAPELKQGQVGIDSKNYLNRLLASNKKSIRLKKVTVDKYGRTVAEVHIGDMNVNRQMIKLGHAFVYHQYLSGCDRMKYIADEYSAKSINVGVWGKNITRPWVFRNNAKR